MGWCSGSEIMDRVIRSALQNVPDEERRKALYMDVIDALMDQGWDTENECLGKDPVFDAALAAVEQREAERRLQRRMGCGR